jgi:hypothetical protein
MCKITSALEKEDSKSIAEGESAEGEISETHPPVGNEAPFLNNSTVSWSTKGSKAGPASSLGEVRLSRNHR